MWARDILNSQTTGEQNRQTPKTSATIVPSAFKSINIHCKIIRCFQKRFLPNCWVHGGRRRTFLPTRLLYTATDARSWRRETHSPAYVYRCNNLRCTFLPARLLCTPQMLDCEGGKHKTPHTYTAATTSTIDFFQRGCCAHPHTYIGATYAVHFFQWGCFAHHRCWITKAGNT